MNEYTKEYALVFKALSDVTRLEILKMLVNGQLCACKILEAFKITQPTLSYHMKIMMESGLVIGERDGAWMLYSINNDLLLSVVSFLSEIEETSYKNKEGNVNGCI